MLSAGNTTAARSLGWRHPAVRQNRQSVAEVPLSLQQTELLKVRELAARLKCSASFSYDRTQKQAPVPCQRRIYILTDSAGDRWLAGGVTVAEPTGWQ